MAKIHGKWQIIAFKLTHFYNFAKDGTENISKWGSFLFCEEWIVIRCKCIVLISHLTPCLALVPLESWTLVLAPASINMLTMSSFPTHAAKDKACSPVRQEHNNTVNFVVLYEKAAMHFIFLKFQCSCVSGSVFCANFWFTIVDESSDPLPEVQTGDPRRAHIPTATDQVLHQIDIPIHNGDVERSDTWPRHELCQCNSWLVISTIGTILDFTAV